MPSVRQDRGARHGAVPADPRRRRFGRPGTEAQAEHGGRADPSLARGTPGFYFLMEHPASLIILAKTRMPDVY